MYTYVLKVLSFKSLNWIFTETKTFAELIKFGQEFHTHTYIYICTVCNVDVF